MAGKAGNTPPTDRSRGKIIFVGILFSCALLGLWARAYYVQVVKGPEYAAKANGQYWTSETVCGKRGEIFDRNNLLLAKSVTTQSVYANPHQVTDRGAAVQRLADILNMQQSAVSRLLDPKKKFVWIRRKISDAQAGQIRESGLVGVHLSAENSRQYPQGSVAGQLLGFVNIDGKGIEGLEKKFNSVLTPSSSKYTVQRDAAGNRLYSTEMEDRTVHNGHDLHLTLDSQVQLATEEALESSVQKARGKSGMGLVVEVATGDILAWAHYPFFNPNALTKTAGEWKNRMAVDNFEPGSTMKPIMVAAALQEKVVSPSSLYFCENGKWSVDGRRIKDTHKYENLTVSKIVRYSSNIGAAKIALDLGARKFYHYLEAVGFTRPVGLPLPGESAGLLRPAGEWRRVELANIAFGQGIAVTMLQMAEAYLCLANGGIRVPLNLEYDPNRKVQGPRVFSEEVCAQVMSMMEDVVQEDGTATQARIKGVRMAGKTGTAQKASPTGGYGSEYVASFVSIFPADKPKYLVYMMVDEPQNGHYGGVLVAPEVRNVAVQMLTASGMLAEPAEELDRAEGMEESRRYVAQVNKVPVLAVNKDAMPDFRGATVRQALEVLVSQGIVPSISGRGAVIEKQQPEPGSKWPSDKKCRLWLAPQSG